jgi:tetratricopeptide (TPR) repeat protein
MARKPSKAAAAALYEAQDIAWDAWDAPDRPRRIALAKKALKVSPLCADAYAILANEAKAGSDEQLELWRRGVAVGEEALGSELFEEMAGHFWGILETRPYMRSRVGLAVALWRRGARDGALSDGAARNEAIGHLQAVLALNPGDNQGARYLLAGWLAQAERGDELEALLVAYADEYSAFWGWSRALAAFRKAGDTAESRALLAEAVEINRHVRDYLCGDRKVPRRKPPYYSPGAASEAMVYIEDHAAAWQSTAGALDWVRTRCPATARRVRRKAAGQTLH